MSFFKIIFIFIFFLALLISLAETFGCLCSKVLLRARLKVGKARLSVRKVCSRCCLAEFQKSPWKDNPKPLGQSDPRLLPWQILFSPLDKRNSHFCSLWLPSLGLSLHSEVWLLLLLKGMTVQLLMEATVSSLLRVPLYRLDGSISLSWTCISMSMSHLYGWPKIRYYSRGQDNQVPSSRNN